MAFVIKVGIPAFTTHGAPVITPGLAASTASARPLPDAGFPLVSVPPDYAAWQHSDGPAAGGHLHRFGI